MDQKAFFAMNLIVFNENSCLSKLDSNRNEMRRSSLGRDCGGIRLWAFLQGWRVGVGHSA